MYTVHLAKEPFKFSCSHFTILSSEHAERLHGHNYQMRVDVTLEKIDPKLGMAFDFNEIKPKIRMICTELDERILLPAESPYLKIENQDAQLRVSFNRKVYVFPSEDCLILPLSNITSEELARYACERLFDALKEQKFWTSVQVEVEETRGQSVSFRKTR
jgi:6-pyruvoyltetrahydropterin/6-carboxytetrahydropterin synthase